MPRARSLLVRFVIALAVAIGFAFTIIRLIAEAVAILALLMFAFRAAVGVLRHAR